MSTIYRYAADLEIRFPEGLEEIKFIAEIDGFNYLSIKQNQVAVIALPLEFEESELPADFLSEIRQEKYDKVEALRKDYQFQNITHNEVELSASIMARQNILGKISTIIDPEAKCYWKDVNEAPLEFVLADFKEMIKIISDRDTKFYYVEAEVRKEIDEKLSSTSLQEIDLDLSWQNHRDAYQG